MAIRVQRKRDLKLGQTLTIGRTSLAVDVGAADGGDGAVPGTHDFYDSALAACKAITVAWYAAHKHIPLEDISVSLERDDRDERAGTYALASKIRVSGPLIDAQLKELKSVAEKCPIHKLMTVVKTTITTELERIA